jgi:hypothetical protein
LIEAGIVTLLLDDAGIAALIGTRMYAVLVPETTVYPCLSYQVVSSVSQYTVDRKEFGQKRIQFDCWASLYSDAENLKQALRNRLTAYSGTLTDGTRVLGTFREVEIDFFEANSGVSGNAGIYRRLCEYNFQFVEQ